MKFKLPKKRNKQEKVKYKSKKKKDSRPIKQRIKESASSGFRSIGDFVQYNKKNLLIFGLIYIGLSLLSLFLTNGQDNGLHQKPGIFFNILPRMVILLLCTLPAFIFSYRRTIFSVGATVWLTWLLGVTGCRISWTLLAATVGLVIAGMLFYVDKRKPVYSKYRTYLLSVNRWVYAFLGLTLIVEILHRMNIITALSNFFFNPDIAALNLIIIALVGCWIFLVPKRKLIFFIYSAVWIILSYGSYLKYTKLSEPILLLDVFSLSDGITAILNFLGFVDILFIILLVVLLVVGIRLLGKREKGLPFQFRNLILVFFTLCIIPVFLYFISNLDYAKLDKSGENTKDAFFRGGFAYSFFFSSVKSGVEMPIDYSDTAVENILTQIDQNYVSKETGEKPTNIIVIQLESFVDSYFFEDMTYEYDPLPFLHSLQENYTSGNIYVPVFGGQTVKSEFEFLTGLAMDTLPAGYNPYVQHLNKNPIDSLTRYMKEKGYTTTAIHNFQGEFFSRNDVYYYLGFDRYIPYETMPNVQKKTPDIIWAGDDVLKEEIQKVLDFSAGGDFIFTVTVQLHGNYNAIPKEEYPMEMSLAPDETGEINEELEGQIAYYTSQMLEVDKAIQSIVEYLEERGEPTFLLMYADHLPTLCNKLVSEENRYTTNYFTWNNLGIEKEEQKDLELYHLSTYLCDMLNLDGTVINKFHSMFSTTANYKKDFSYLEYYKLYEEYQNLYNTNTLATTESEATADPYDKTFYIVGVIFIVLICIFAFAVSGKRRGIFMICSALLILVLIFGIFLFIPSTDSEQVEEEVVYENKDYVVSGVVPLTVDRMILSDELLIVQGTGITQNTYLSVSNKNYPLIFVDANTAIYTEFDVAMDESDKISLKILGERNNTVFSESEPFLYENLEDAIDVLPENVQKKLDELNAEESPEPTETPSPNTNAEED